MTAGPVLSLALGPIKSDRKQLLRLRHLPAYWRLRADKELWGVVGYNFYQAGQIKLHRTDYTVGLYTGELRLSHFVKTSSPTSDFAATSDTFCG